MVRQQWLSCCRASLFGRIGLLLHPGAREYRIVVVAEQLESVRQFDRFENGPFGIDLNCFSGTPDEVIGHL